MGNFVLFGFAIFLLLNLKAGYASEDYIVIHTRKDAVVYNFFPLKCNYVEFLVKAKSDVHFVLTTSYYLDAPFYETVIGGSKNTLSLLYKDQRSYSKAKNLTHQVVHEKEYRGFWVALDPVDKNIAIGRMHQDSFLFYKDPAFTKMNYFGISTGYGSKGVFKFELEVLNCSGTYTGSHEREGKAAPIYTIENLNIIN